MSLSIDITNSFNALLSLESWLNIPGDDILKYLFKKKVVISLDNFIEKFSIKEETLLNSDLNIVSLHVTTNNDKCASIKKYGLRNLQDTIRLDTPLGKFIREHGIEIDIDNKIIEYQGKSYDISKRIKGASHGSKEGSLDMVVYKLFEDYQINGFVFNKNVLRYGGGVRYRPEFLNNLSHALGNESIENDWFKLKNECFVIKYSNDLSELTYYTFGLKVLNIQDYFENIEEYELDKRRWILETALNVMVNEINGNHLSDIHSFTLFDVKVPIENIEILTANDYLAAYEISD